MTSYLHKDDELIEKQLGAYTANAEKISDMGGQLSVLGQQLDQSFISNLVLDGLMQEVLGPKVREGDGKAGGTGRHPND